MPTETITSNAPSAAAASRRRALVRIGAGVFGVGAANAWGASEPAARAAPDFTLRKLDGAPLRLQEQRGQVVLLNFWATWCGPCRQEMPLLNKLHEKYRASGFLLLGINVDDDPRNGAALATKLGLTFPVLFDTDKAVSQRYEVKTMPSTVVIDRDGRVRHLHRGYADGYVQEYEKQVRALLRE